MLLFQYEIQSALIRILKFKMLNVLISMLPRGNRLNTQKLSCVLNVLGYRLPYPPHGR